MQPYRTKYKLANDSSPSLIPIINQFLLAKVIQLSARTRATAKCNHPHLPNSPPTRHTTAMYTSRESERGSEHHTLGARGAGRSGFSFQFARAPSLCTHRPTLFRPYTLVAYIYAWYLRVRSDDNAREHATGLYYTTGIARDRTNERTICPNRFCINAKTSSGPRVYIDIYIYIRVCIHGTLPASAHTTGLCLLVCLPAALDVYRCTYPAVCALARVCEL